MDAVILWVDGNDPVHVAKRNAMLALTGHPPADAVSPTRFSSLNEIEFCLEGILRFAPFFRRIFIVTDDQSPDCLPRIFDRFEQARSKIQVVDHKVIFKGHEDLLPTFNSEAIETMVFNIPDIDDEFVYFNDDFLLLRPIEPSDFFLNGRPQLQGAWAQALRQKIKVGLRYLGIGRASRHGISRKELMWRSACLAGQTRRYLANTHTPHPMRRSTLQKFFADHFDLLRLNTAFRFRDQRMFNVVALADHLEIAAGNFDLVDHGLLYIDPAGQDNHSAYVAASLNAATRQKPMFGTIQSLDLFNEEARGLILEWLMDLGFESKAQAPH